MNKKEQIYIVSHSGFDHYDPIIFIGPILDNWKDYCNSFVDEAAKKVLSEERGWCGWGDIVKELCIMLEKKGYKRIKPDEANFFGGNIIGHIKSENDQYGLSDEVYKLVKDHNDKIAKELYGNRK